MKSTHIIIFRSILIRLLNLLAPYSVLRLQHSDYSLQPEPPPYFFSQFYVFTNLSKNFCMIFFSYQVSSTSDAGHIFKIPYHKKE